MGPCTHLKIALCCASEFMVIPKPQMAPLCSLKDGSPASAEAERLWQLRLLRTHCAAGSKPMAQRQHLAARVVSCATAPKEGAANNRHKAGRQR